MKTEFDFSAKPLQPGERLAYTFETRTPAQAAKMTADTVAWNSVAVGARTIASDGVTPGSALPTEGLRVGVALATGPLAVEKIVEGPGAEFAPDEFEVQVQCTVPDREGFGKDVVLDPVTVTVTAGEPVTLEEQFPWGAQCKVLEDAGLNGETSSSASDPVTVGRDTDPVPVLTLTNTYDLGSFTVAKIVEGATNEAGEAIDYGSFPVAAECSFLGEEIPLDPATVELTHGGNAWLVEGLPVGAKCTLTELDAKGGEATLTGGDAAQNEDGSWTFTVEEGPTSLALELTNVMPLGAIDLEKQLAGAGAAAVYDSTVFTFAVECTFEDQTVYDGTVELTKAEAVAGTVKRIDTLPAGAQCGVTETGVGGATSTTLTPDTSTEKLEVGTIEAPLQFTAVNTFDAGSLHVSKEITGAGAELWSTGTFEVSLACTTGGAEGVPGDAVSIPGGAERELSEANGYEASYGELPVGAKCDLTETVTGGATSSEIVDAAGSPITGPIEIGAGDAVELRVVNTFDIGSIAVKKEITGAGASLAGDKTFTVALACSVDRDGTVVDIAIPGGADREISKQSGLAASYERLPVGAECELRETGTGGGKTVSITPNRGDVKVGAVTVASGAAAQLTVVNEFPGVPVNPEEPGKPNISETGGGLPVGWVVGGGALLVLGAVLLVLRSRKQKGE